jgi:hypothetical protein
MTREVCQVVSVMNSFCVFENQIGLMEPADKNMKFQNLLKIQALSNFELLLTRRLEVEESESLIMTS